MQRGQFAPLSEGLADRLGGAMASVSDELFRSFEEGQLDRKAGKWDHGDTWLGLTVPERFVRQLTPGIVRNFVYALGAVSARILGPVQTRAACRAEEMLVYWTIERLKAHNAALDGNEEDAEADQFLEDYLEDFDFEFLYDPRHDGIDQIAGIGSLSMEHWFLPYNHSRVTCPITWPEKIAYHHPNWRHTRYPSDARDAECTAVCQIHIQLDGTDPPIWRRILIPDYYTFWDLHSAIQDAMGWHDRREHQFILTDPGSVGVQRIGLPNEPVWEEPDLPEWLCQVSSTLNSGTATLTYLYDPEHEWTHTITFEKVRDRLAGEHYPICVAGERACPREEGSTGAFPVSGVDNRLFDPEAFVSGEVRFVNPAERFRKGSIDDFLDGIGDDSESDREED